MTEGSRGSRSGIQFFPRPGSSQEKIMDSVSPHEVGSGSGQYKTGSVTLPAENHAKGLMIVGCKHEPILF